MFVFVFGTHARQRKTRAAGSRGDKETAPLGDTVLIVPAEERHSREWAAGAGVAVVGGLVGWGAVFLGFALGIFSFAAEGIQPELPKKEQLGLLSLSPHAGNTAWERKKKKKFGSFFFGDEKKGA